MALLDNISQIDCTAIDCTSALGAAADQLQDCPKNITRAEVNTIILQHPTLGTAITNWPATGETGLLITDFDIDNTDVLDVSQKQFFGVGTVSEPEESAVPLNDGQEHILNRKYTLVFTMWDIPAATYDYLRQIQCGVVKPKFTYGDRANYLYGIDGGLVASKWTVAFPKNTGDDAVNNAQITVTWDAKTDPDRVISPL